MKPIARERAMRWLKGFPRPGAALSLAYDLERTDANLASEEAYQLWADITDKPHRALQYIDDALRVAGGEEAVLHPPNKVNLKCQ